MILTKAFIKKINKNISATLDILTEDELVQIIKESSIAYYNDGASPISDEIFDLVKDKLTELNPNNPALKEVGAPVIEKKELLPCYMGSLDKIKTDTKILDKWQTKYKGAVIISDKLDGNSGLYYKVDNTIKLFTRGDGTYGQNVSNLTIHNLPKPTSDDITVRGEFIISKTDFPKIKKKLANARNAVAGVLNAKKPSQEVMKYVKFIAYELIYPKLSPGDGLKYLKDAGFDVVDYIKKNKYDVEILSDILMNRREKGDYEIDGLVVTHDEIHKVMTKENPKYAFAFKNAFTLDKAEVTVTQVEWNSSKDGYLKPTVIFEPVKLDGVVIQKATGFNAKFIKENNIGSGTVIIIIRAGQVIPHIKEVLKPTIAQMPDCEYKWNATNVDIIADVVTDIQDIMTLTYFFSKLDVKGIGEGNIAKMYKAGLNTVGKIIHATKDELAKVDGFKSKSVDNIYNVLSVVKLDCIDIMDGSNTLGRGIGRKKLEAIIEALPKIVSEKYIPHVEELTSIKGIEKKTAESIITGLPKYWTFVDSNDLKCIFGTEEMVPDAEDNVEREFVDIFKNQKIVMTGFRNKNIEIFVKEQGGEVVGSVSSKTTLIIAKDVDEDSGKLTKARELNIKIISSDEFIKTYSIPI